jgi:hypothetical protein
MRKIQIPRKWYFIRKAKLERYTAATEAEISQMIQDQIKNEMKIILIFTAVFVICLIGMICSHFKGSSTANIDRNQAGDGEQEQDITICVDGEKYQYGVSVSDRVYTKEEREQAFEEAFSYLEKKMKNRNQSLEEVHSNLNLITEIEDSPIEVQWELEDESLIDREGTVHNKNINEGYQKTHIKAILTYLTYQKEKVYEVRVYPKIISESRRKANNIYEQIKKLEKESRTKDSFLLPLEIQGYKIQLSNQKNQWGILLILTIVCGGLFAARQWENEKQREKEIKRASELEYSNILWQFELLLEAGFTVPTAWKKIIEDYEKKKIRIAKERQYVYEQMKYAYHQMELGYSVERVFHMFSKKMRLKSYSKLMTLFLQNMTKGSKNMLEILKNEEQQAFLIRCEQAKRMGEEADTKLLLPMGMMLLDILLLLMVPAYLQM